MNRDEIKNLREKLAATTVNSVGELLMFTNGIRVEDFRYHFFGGLKDLDNATDILRVLIHVPNTSSEPIPEDVMGDYRPASGKYAAQYFKEVCMATFLKKVQGVPDIGNQVPEMRVSYITDGTGEFGIV